MTTPNVHFGFDIDGTVTDPATFVPYLNDHFNRSIRLEDITEYDLTNVLNITQEDFWNWMQQHEHHIYQQADLAVGVDKALESWQQHGRLTYVSARGEHLLSTTKQWLETNNLPYHHIELIGKHDKLESIQNHNIDIFFEDKHDNACDIAEACNIPVVLLDTPYNRKPAPEQVVRANNWNEAKAWVDAWLTM
ncbi:hypothetical protein B0H94_1161 [Salsuginibacillus halophilus]|uniref:Nucleotidase n=1 Tax=Salsuginibacillus halophilus TaxID=517424 RepID=A0A2P8H7V5_9BACI|nr:hypothetical protein [Salsuginibacillus halophilus]PSL42302.1 hypothetical protein B0H94_1161 [Salsuginibacillus halophilus]